ncbi:rhodanese-like domain-containing protein [Planktosalinus lacus]|uniref:Rhodanese n=1 Tax=Planktosalinus lacus TaxID=1526573 RepID=A0A8J2Y7L6_9FLAO|nr:rhodanese-like domain-containing protein [Planktosalinus lacus]GGD88647.1 rhodanese [Planktosalinus lacus]
MKKYLYFSIILFFSIFTACQENESAHIQKISVEQLLEAINSDDVQLIDVRTEGEFNDGSIQRAQNICVTTNGFKEKVKNLDKEKPVYLYCKSGKRSANAAEILKEMGFKEIYDMTGGYDEWSEKQLKNKKS